MVVVAAAENVASAELVKVNGPVLVVVIEELKLNCVPFKEIPETLLVDKEPLNVAVPVALLRLIDPAVIP